MDLENNSLLCIWTDWSTHTRENPYIWGMLKPKDLINASFEAGRSLLHMPPRVRAAGEVAGAPPALVPIRSLGENHRERIERHLLSLAPHDRYLRFGYAAQDTQIERYVAGLDFERDEIFGIYNRKLQLLAVAHLAYTQESQRERAAEFGVSVLAAARGKGFGARLFERAAMHAGNDGIGVMYIHALSENAAMLKIARNAGARLERDGTESAAYLQLPKATLDSRLTELVEEQLAKTDYRMKVQAKQFWSLIAGLQKIRQKT